MVSCVAYGCTNRTSKKMPGITFHTFPKDEVRKKLWIKAVKRKNWYPTNYSRLCSKHFPERMFDRTSLAVVRLREDAYPTIFEAFPSYLKQISSENPPKFTSEKELKSKQIAAQNLSKLTSEKDMENEQPANVIDCSKDTTSTGLRKICLVPMLI